MARVADESIGTIRVVLVMSGKKGLAPLIGFFESLIWLLAIGQIFQHIDNPVSYILYATGYAFGTYVGIISKRIFNIEGVKKVSDEDMSFKGIF